MSYCQMCVYFITSLQDSDESHIVVLGIFAQYYNSSASLLNKVFTVFAEYLSKIMELMLYCQLEYHRYYKCIGTVNFFDN